MCSRRSLLLGAVLVGAGCSSTPPYVWVTALPPAELRGSDALRVGDRVQVVVAGQDTLSGEFEIRASGAIVMPVAGSVPAAGKTTDALAADLTVRLQGVVASPRVTVIVGARRPTGVSVLGEVKTPGRYELADGEGVLHALARAGGLTEFADPDWIFVVRANAGRRIRFRYVDLSTADPASTQFRLMNGDVVVVE